MLVYPSRVDLSSSVLRFLTTCLREHRRLLGTRWRRLSAGRQALLALAHLRNGPPTPNSRPRSASAPPPPTATSPKRVRPAGWQAPAVDRIAADRPFYSGKLKKHGMNVQVIAEPSGRLLWASPALHGAVHDVRAARENGIIDALAEASVPCWADKAYRGAGGTVRVPWPSPPSSPGDCCASCDARPLASRASSRLSSACIRPAQTEDGKGSLWADRVTAPCACATPWRGRVDRKFPRVPAGDPGPSSGNTPWARLQFWTADPCGYWARPCLNPGERPRQGVDRL